MAILRIRAPSKPCLAKALIASSKMRPLTSSGRRLVFFLGAMVFFFAIVVRAFLTNVCNGCGGSRIAWNKRRISLACNPSPATPYTENATIVVDVLQHPQAQS